MKIAIIGAGFSGSYLARRLITEGIAKPEHIHIFEYSNKLNKKRAFIDNNNRPCGSPCAWGIHQPTLEEAIEKTQIGDPEEFILQSFDTVLMGDINPTCRLCTFNKPLFEQRCIEDLQVITDSHMPVYRFNNYDIIVDATATRAVIGKMFDTLKDPLWIYTRQIRVDMKSPKMKISRHTEEGVGYEWVFPLGELGTHIGYGKIGFTGSKYDSDKKICACSGRIRLSAPKYSFPLYTKLGVVAGDGRDTTRDTTVITVGESAGMISSVTGGGNKEAIDGIEILLKYWGDFPTAYDKIIEEFRWAEREFSIIKRLSEGKSLSLSDLKVIAKNAKRYDIAVGVKEAIVLVKNIIGDKFVKVM